MTIKNNSISITKANSWKMFNDISPRYDLLNNLLSFGLHIHWKNQLAKFLPNKDNLKVLDLATGTADILINLFKNSQHVQTGYGLDMAEKMLEIGNKKIAHLGLHNKIILQPGDAHNIPFNNNTFDTVTISFGIRNMTDHAKVLQEIYRVLNKGGKAIVLEFSLPENPLLRGLHLFYLRFVVPTIGALFSGHYQAYRYLNQTIEDFPYGKNFCKVMQDSGFSASQNYPLMGGIATIYVGEKS